MEKISDTVAFLNPGQVPVSTADQPIMSGGLQIELAALRSIGTLLQDSGWTGALFEAEPPQNHF